MKINQLNINGLRGIRKKLSIDIGDKSILLYGDNGTGKSSISDVLEWFYTDTVSHLSIGEINLKEALRNSFLADNEVSAVGIEFNLNKLNNEKTLSFQKGKWQSGFSNNSGDWNKYINLSKNENLILRYQSLREFIEQTKSVKLSTLSNIIGFSEITSTQDVLRKVFNSIKNEIKNQNFEGQINTQKQILIDKIGAVVTQEKDLFEKLNEVIKDKKTGLTIKKMADLDKVLEFFKRSTNTQLTSELTFFEKCSATLTNLKNEYSTINESYAQYFAEFEKIFKDVESVKQILLSQLLKAGNAVLTKKYHKDETCPLCLQVKSLNNLQNEIVNRLKVIEESNKKKASFDAAKELIISIANERIFRLNSVLSEKLMREDKNGVLKNSLTNLLNKVTAFQHAGNQKVLAGKMIAEPSALSINDADFGVLTHITERITALTLIISKDNSTQLYADISAAQGAFKEIIKIKSEENKLEHQKKSLEIIYNEFMKKQKEGLDDFISSFSETINKFYQYMNPAELFLEIRIVIIGEEDELKGITIEYKYQDNWVSPPQKYFSESHINCLGISFFLASVVAFNKKNRFFILDDVISSFDTTHRKKFADLLFEHFSDWQIILLTHERVWYESVEQLAKRKGWQIKEIKWARDEGSYIDTKPSALKELIEEGIAKGSADLLGNPLRQYLEQVLKGICLNLEVKMAFRLNSQNEKRMPDELLNELRSKIKSHSCELKSKLSILDQVASAAILGNLLSHNNLTKETIGDIKAFWDDIQNLETIFYCQNQNCSRPPVSLKNYDNVAKKIRCGCDKTKYDWK